ncbi:MAG TPA: dienelactone hydrolase family protein [Burkholderiaceae bacterium]
MSFATDMPDRTAVAAGDAAPGQGFAAAVRAPVAHALVHTDAEGLESGPVAIPAGDIALPAYYAKPQGAGGLPVVLVVSEIFGVHEHVADVARRFARLGYLAVAPELFVRQGNAKAYTDIPRLQAEIVEKTPDAQVLADLDVTLAWAEGRGGDLGRLGVTGFCWGGRITWLYAAHQARVRAGVAWYGKLQAPATPIKPRHPVDVAGELRAPVLGLYGGQDASIPPAQVEAMRAALAAGNEAARASTIVVYPDAGHAFHADYRPSYDAKAAQDGWRRCLDWLARHGVAP